MNETKLGPLSNKSLIVGVYVAALSLILTTPAYAYFDAGTISIFLQGLVGGVAVAIASISIFWHKIWNFFFGNKSEKNEEEITNEQELDWRRWAKGFTWKKQGRHGHCDSFKHDLAIARNIPLDQVWQWIQIYRSTRINWDRS